MPCVRGIPRCAPPQQPLPACTRPQSPCRNTKRKLHNVQDCSCNALHTVQCEGMNSTIRYIADSKGNVFTATPAFHHGHLTLKDMIDPSCTTVVIHESELTHSHQTAPRASVRQRRRTIPRSERNLPPGFCSARAGRHAPRTHGRVVQGGLNVQSEPRHEQR